MTTADEVVSNDGGGGAVAELHSSKAEEEEEEENVKKKEKMQEGGEAEEEQHQLLTYLDECIVTNILIKVHSAESLYNSLRYVCKLWNNIISHHPDIHLSFLLPSKPPCLIIQNEDETSHTFYKSKTEEELLALSADDLSYTSCSVNMEVREGGVVEQQVHDLTPILKKLFIRACCNGLMLATPSGSSNLETLCVVNPLTNHRVVLPPRPIDSYFVPLPVGFIFLPCTGKYKVVTAGHKPRDQTPYNLIQVLTLSSSPGNCCSNNDDPSRLWRLVEAPLPLFSHPLLIHEVLYWFLRDPDYLVSFDASAEIFHITRHSLFFHKKSRGFIEIGGYLAFWYFLPDKVKLSKSRTFHVHVIEDLHKPGAKWKVLHGGVRMDIDFIKARQGRPVLSIGNGEVIIFHHSSRGALWAYNFRSQRWWRVGHCLKEWDTLNFSGFHVKSSTHVPFDSLFSTL